MFKILTVGRLVEQKGIDIAIKSAAILKNRGFEFQWYVIGEGKLFDALMQQIISEGIEDRFHLMGRKENPYPYMRDCDLYVQPSRHEGYAITIVEAKTLCKPIIVSDIPSFREQISDGNNGFVVKLNEYDIAEEIIQLSNNPDKMKKVSDMLRKSNLDYSSEYEKLAGFIHLSS